MRLPAAPPAGLISAGLSRSPESGMVRGVGLRSAPPLLCGAVRGGTRSLPGLCCRGQQNPCTTAGVKMSITENRTGPEPKVGVSWTLSIRVMEGHLAGLKAQSFWTRVWVLCRTRVCWTEGSSSACCGLTCCPLDQTGSSWHSCHVQLQSEQGLLAGSWV